MNYVRIVLSAAAAMVAFFVYGLLVHGLLIAKDYVPYPEGVYRSGDTARSLMPVGLTGLFVAMLVFCDHLREGLRARIWPRSRCPARPAFRNFHGRRIRSRQLRDHQHRRKAGAGVGG